MKVGCSQEVHGRRQDIQGRPERRRHGESGFSSSREASFEHTFGIQPWVVLSVVRPYVTMYHALENHVLDWRRGASQVHRGLLRAGTAVRLRGTGLKYEP